MRTPITSGLVQRRRSILRCETKPSETASRSRCRSVSPDKRGGRSVKVPDVAQIEAGGLAFFLRAIFALSLVYIVVSPFGDSMSQMSDDSTERYGHPDASGREEIYMRKLARAVNPNGVAPILMTLSAGFLAILRGQRASAELLLAELRASPAATAGAPK